MGKLLHAEWYKFIHDKIFFITCAATVIFNLIVFSGSPIFTLTGHSALVESMKKEIATAILSCIYGGIFLGGDFAERTLYHGITSGNGRGKVIVAKSVVYAAATDVLLYLFPIFNVIICTAKNGLGIEASFSHVAGVIAALLFLGFSISAVSTLAAVCFRDIGRTIGIPAALYFVMILLLNSPYSEVFSRLLPIGAVILVADGTISPVCGGLVGILWFALLTAVSSVIFRRAQLR